MPTAARTRSGRSAAVGTASSPGNIASFTGAAITSQSSWVARLRSEVEGLLDRGRGAAAITRFPVGIGMPRPFAVLLA